MTLMYLGKKHILMNTRLCQILKLAFHLLRWSFRKLSVMQIASIDKDGISHSKRTVLNTLASKDRNQLVFLMTKVSIKCYILFCFLVNLKKNLFHFLFHF